MATTRTSFRRVGTATYTCNVRNVHVQEVHGAAATAVKGVSPLRPKPERGALAFYGTVYEQCYHRYLL